MYRISNFLLFKGSIVGDLRKWGWILNEFSKITNQLTQEMSVVKDGAGSQRVASSVSVYATRQGSTLHECQRFVCRGPGAALICTSPRAPLG